MLQLFWGLVLLLASCCSFHHFSGKSGLLPGKSCKNSEMDILFVLDGCTTEIPASVLRKLIFDIFLNFNETKLERVRFAGMANYENCLGCFNFSRYEKPDEVLDALNRMSQHSLQCNRRKQASFFNKSLDIHNDKIAYNRNKMTLFITHELFEQAYGDMEIEFGLDSYLFNKPNHSFVVLLLSDLPYNFYPWMFLPKLFIVNFLTDHKIKIDYTLCFYCQSPWVSLGETFKWLAPAYFLFGYSVVPISWNQAEAVCRYKGGELATFETIEKWEQVYDYVQSMFPKVFDDIFISALASSVADICKSNALNWQNRGEVKKRIKIHVEPNFKEKFPSELPKDLGASLFSVVSELIYNFSTEASSDGKNVVVNDLKQACEQKILKDYILANVREDLNPADELLMHFGLKRFKEYWGGWSLRWGQKHALNIRRNNSRFDWTDSRFCMFTSFSFCDWSETKYLCLDIEEKPTACWNKIAHYYVCEYPNIFPSSLSNNRLRKDDAEDSLMAKAPSIVKCILQDGDSFLWLVFQGNLFITECKEVIYYINGHQVENAQALVAILPKFHCHHHSKHHHVISYRSVCNKFKDCEDSQDETCTNYQCHGDVFMCNDQCFSTSAQCDLFKDCPDGSDEIQCENICKHYSCKLSGECLPKSVVLDGVVDCLDGSDENKLEAPWSKDSCLFTCNRLECVSRDMLKDAAVIKKVCIESGDPTGIHFSEFISVQCVGMDTTPPYWAPKCMYLKDRFGIIIGCRNFEHLTNCKDFYCPKGFYQCLGVGYCIPGYYLKDGSADCPLEDDEDLSQYMYSFACDSTLKSFVSADQVCDGYADCLDGADEANCHQSCGNGFTCVESSVFVTDPKSVDSVTWEALSFIDETIKYLDLSGTDQEHLFEIFEEKDKERFGGLLYLNLSGCNLENISFSVPSTFKTMQSVDLSRNKLKYYPMSTGSVLTDRMGGLMYLNLSGNIHLSDANALIRGKMFLEVLDLSHTALTKVPDLVKTLISLKHLNLSETNLQILQVGDYPGPLKTLILTHIPESVKFGPGLFNLRNLRHLSVSIGELCCPDVLGTESNTRVCESETEVVSSCRYLIESPFLQVVIWILAFLSVSFNVMSLIYKVTVERNIQTKSHAVIVANLNCSDLLMAGYLIIIASQAMGYEGNYSWNGYEWRQSALCSFAGLLSTISNEASTFFIFGITLDRFLVVRYPYKIQSKYENYVKHTCTGGWFVAISLALFPLFIPSWNFYSSSALCNYMPIYKVLGGEWLYNTILFTGLNFILFLATSSLLLGIFWAIASHNRVLQKMKKRQSVFHRKQRIADRLLAKRLALVCVTNLMCWLPQSMLNVYRALGTQIDTLTQAYVAILIMPLNSVLNPLLYNIPRMIDKVKILNWHNAEEGPDHGYTPLVRNIIKVLRVALYLNRTELDQDAHRRFTEGLSGIKRALQQVFSTGGYPFDIVVNEQLSLSASTFSYTSSSSNTEYEEFLGRDFYSSSK